MEQASVYSTLISDMWTTDTTYYMNTKTKYPSEAKVYVNRSKDDTSIYWDTNSTPTDSNWTGLESITVPAGSASDLSAAGAIYINVTINGVTSSTRANYVGYVNDPSFPEAKAVTYLRFSTIYGDIILGPSQGVSNGIYENSWTTGLPTTIKCFLADVEIKTPSGVKLIQDLKINDEVIVIKENNETIQKITSIVSQTVIIKNKDQLPIRILKSAIANNIPYKDLLITPEHCLFIEGQFIPAHMLVNGRSIIQDTSFTTYNYYHIETEKHSIVIADGMLTESYLNTDTKINNHLSIKGNKTWEKDAAAPLNTSRNFVETIYQQIENRAKLQNLPDNRNKYKLTNNSNLYLTTPEGHILSAIYTKDNYVAFRLPPNIDHITLHSRTSRPSDVIGSFIDDRRNLGVLINNITLSDNDETFVIDSYLNVKNLQGWSVQEQASCRWTLGRAELPLMKRNKDTIGILRISIAAGGPYIVEEEQEKVIQQAI